MGHRPRGDTTLNERLSDTIIPRAHIDTPWASTIAASEQLYRRREDPSGLIRLGGEPRKFADGQSLARRESCEKGAEAAGSETTAKRCKNANLAVLQ